MTEALLAAGVLDETSGARYKGQLHRAALMGGHRAVTEVLLAHYGRPHDFLSACAVGAYSTAAHFLEDDSSITSELFELDRHSYAGIHLAARNGHCRIIDLLLSAGCDPNLQDSEGKTALHHACFRGHRAVVNSVIAAGADVTIRTSLGVSALHHVQGMFSAAMLIDHGAEVNARDNSGQTPLLMHSADENTELVQLLLLCGADPTIPDDFGGTAILYAVRLNEDPAVTRMLLRHGAEPQVANEEGESAVTDVDQHDPRFADLIRTAVENPGAFRRKR